jgi:hypothetical protein
VRPLERRCRWLLRFYPGWYRRERSGEMLGTLLEASPPGRRWPSFRDARALVTGGLRVRGWTWMLSMLWAAAGFVYVGYCFYITTKPWTGVDLGIEGWSGDPVVVQLGIAWAIVTLVALPIPVLVAGFIRLRGWRRGNWLRAAAWAGAWIAGVALWSLASVWGEYPLNSCPNRPLTAPQCPSGSPAVVSWGELAICAAWLVLGAVMTWILARPSHSSRSRFEMPRMQPRHRGLL